MTLDEKIAAWRERMARKYAPNVDGFHWFDDAPAQQEALQNAFLAGARAESEVARLAGRIEALTFANHYTDGAYSGLYAELHEVKSRLEALLDPAAEAK